jgi:hypothetical protein
LFFEIVEFIGNTVFLKPSAGFFNGIAVWDAVKFHARYFNSKSKAKKQNSPLRGYFGIRRK